MNCLHGLPSYCCAVCNGIKLDKPEFRRRRDEANLLDFGPSSLSMQSCAVNESRFKASGPINSTWRRSQADRDLLDFFKTLHTHR